MIAPIVRMLADRRGASLIEYTLILTLIAVVAIVVISTFGSNISATIQSEAQSI